MKKVLIAVDDTKGSKAVLLVFSDFMVSAVEIILLHVERLEGKSLMIDMLGEAEMSTLKDSIRDTEHKDGLDKKAERILDYYKKELESKGQIRVKTIIREGHPAEEILKVSEEEGAELIILGYSGKKWLNRIITGNVAKEVEGKAKVPVLMARREIMEEEIYNLRGAYKAIFVTTVVVFGMFLLSMFLLGFILEKEPFLH